MNYQLEIRRPLSIIVIMSDHVPVRVYQKLITGGKRYPFTKKNPYHLLRATYYPTIDWGMPAGLHFHWHRSCTPIFASNHRGRMLNPSDPHLGSTDPLWLSRRFSDSLGCTANCFYWNSNSGIPSHWLLSNSKCRIFCTSATGFGQNSTTVGVWNAPTLNWPFSWLLNFWKLGSDTPGDSGTNYGKIPANCSCARFRIYCRLNSRECFSLLDNSAAVHGCTLSVAKNRNPCPTTHGARPAPLTPETPYRNFLVWISPWLGYSTGYSN